MFRCWMGNVDEEEFALAIDDALDAEDAAQLACEKWERGGSFAGDPYPNPIEVYVRDETGGLVLVKVEPSFDVSFYATSSKPVTP